MRARENQQIIIQLEHFTHSLCLLIERIRSTWWISSDRLYHYQGDYFPLEKFSHTVCQRNRGICSIWIVSSDKVSLTEMKDLFKFFLTICWLRILKNRMTAFWLCVAVLLFMAFWFFFLLWLNEPPVPITTFPYIFHQTLFFQPYLIKYFCSDDRKRSSGLVNTNSGKKIPL